MVAAMTFTITYRGADGALRTEAVEAASRADCLAQMKARGVSVQSVKAYAGKHTSHGGAKREPIAGTGRNRHAVACALSVACVLLAGGIGWYWLSGRHSGEATLQNDGPKKPSAFAKEVKPAAAPKPAPLSKTNSMATSRTTAPAVDTMRGPITNEAATKKTSWPPPPVERDARGRVIPPSGAITLDEQNSIFERNSDTYIAMLVSPRSGSALPPMPLPGPTMEEDFRASLKEPIAIEPDDPPENRAIKLAVMAAREEIKRLLDGGAKFADIVREHEMLLKENTEIREKALSEYRAIKKSGDEKGAEQYFKTINIALQQMGVAPMTKSTSHEEVRARMLEAKMRQQQEKGK